MLYKALRGGKIKMDISFTHTTKSVYREIACPFKRIQISSESVVPDTNEDIGRIASVRSSVLLKSKEKTSRGISITGEWHAVMLYITEREDTVSSIRLQNDFQIDFETDKEISDILSHVRLTVCHTETRVLNPRKVVVTAEVLGELSAFRQEELIIQSSPLENPVCPLYTKTECEEVTPINAVCEKTFAVNEQFIFPEGKPEPSQLVSENAVFEIDEVQQVGSRVVAKGSVYLDVCYLSEDAVYPIRTEFSMPFSQILDTGAEECVSSTTHVELTSVYYDLVDTISGRKALDAEFHAVLQMVSRCRQDICYISDAYCNRFPYECGFQTALLSCVEEKRGFRSIGEDDLSIAEDCEDILSVLPTLMPVNFTEGKAELQLALDILYRSKAGSLSSVRRMLEFEQKALPENLILTNIRMTQLDLRPSGTGLHCCAEVELAGQEMNTSEVSAVSSIQIQEDQPISSDTLPSVTLVRIGSEELWDLAKQYHSTLQSIQSANPGCEIREGCFVLVPREN